MRLDGHNGRQLRPFRVSSSRGVRLHYSDFACPHQRGSFFPPDICFAQHHERREEHFDDWVQ